MIPWLRGRVLRDVLGCLVQRRTSRTLGRLYGSFAGGLEWGVMPFVTMVLGPNLGRGHGRVCRALRCERMLTRQRKDRR